MGTSEALIQDAGGLNRVLEDLARQILQNRRAEVPLRLVGVRTRGVPIAERLAAILRSETDGAPIPVGAVDITMYRDDLSQREHWPVLRGTDIPFAVEGTELVLVDDVLFTGRTVRAALNAICDLGRPARARLAVVVDRGGRELPFQADYVGLRVEAKTDERVLVRIQPVDQVDQIIKIQA